MRSMLQNLTPEDQKKVRMFLDKKDEEGLSYYLGSRGQSILYEKVTALAGCRDLGEALEITGDIPERERILELFSILDKVGISYTLNPGIARGLDYYTGMVFEIFAENLGAENQVLGGGTYQLAHLFGGEETPSCGFAIGFDRVMVARGEKTPSRDLVTGVAFTPEGRDWALTVAREFRRAGIRTELDLSGKSISQQLSRIARIADFALIIGKRESEQKVVTIKDLSMGIQKELALPDAIGEVTGSGPR